MPYTGTEAEVQTDAKRGPGRLESSGLWSLQGAEQTRQGTRQAPRDDSHGQPGHG